MEHCTKVNGKMTKQTVRAELFIRKEMSTRDNGKKTRQTAMEYLQRVTAPYTKGSGSKMKNMERVFNIGQMDRLIKGLLRKDTRREKD